MFATDLSATSLFYATREINGGMVSCCEFDPDFFLRNFAVHLQMCGGESKCHQATVQSSTYITASEDHVDTSLTIIMQ